MAEASSGADGVVIKCLNEKCNLASSRFLNELGSAGIVFSIHALKNNCNEQSLDLLSNIRHTNFILVFDCMHIQSYQRLDKDLIIYCEKVAVVVDKDTRWSFDPKFKLFQSHDYSTIIQHLQQLIEHSDEELNEYHPPVPPRRNQSILEFDQTIPKKKEMTVEDIRFDPLPQHVECGFINVDTFDSNDTCNRGTYVQQSTCTPTTYVASPISEIKRRFNGANDEERENLSKQILSITIKRLEKECNFVDLICLIDIDDSRIQRCVFNAIEDLQLQTNINSRCTMGMEILKGTKHLLELCSKFISDQSVMLRLLPTTMDTLSRLFLLCANATLQSTLVPDTNSLVKESLPVFSKLVKQQNLEFDTHLQSMLISLQKLIHHFATDEQRTNTVYFGNVRESLVHDESRVRLKAQFDKSMTYLEQYSFLLAVINQLLQRTDILFVSYLQELTTILVNKVSKKAKLLQTVFAEFTLITKGVIHRLCKRPKSQMTTTEYQSTLCKVLNCFLASAKINQRSRHFLLDLAAPLLFHENKDVVQNMVYLFQINKYCSQHIRDQVSKYIVHQLAVVNFKIDGVVESPSTVGLKPTWVTFAGTFSEDRRVVLKVLVPTLHCIAGGNMADYKHKADKRETRRHLNCLDVMKHLQDGKSHHNLIELLAFQCRPLPIFYVTDYSFYHDLNYYLLDVRRVCRWLTPRELVTIVADAVDAVCFLHSRHVIHRNLTTFAFCMRANNHTIALHDLTLANVLEKDTGFLSELENTDVPVLWTAPESILEDHYDVKTDTWMIGQFIYEVFTHGCHPYTEIYGASTEQILEYVVFQELKPYKWPCIPKEIHEIICQCCAYKPEDRKDINGIGETLNNFLASLRGDRRQKVTQVFEEDKKYPSLDATQDKPERGLPYLFKQLKQNNTQERGVIRKSYFNARLSQRRNPNALQITSSDVKSADQAIYQIKFNYVSVFEPVTVNFVQSLSHLDRQTYTDILHMVDSPSREERRHCPGVDYPYLLKYKLKKSEMLLDLAFRKVYNDPENNLDQYLELVVKALQFVSEMHKRKWILRDICAENLRVVHKSKEVIMARLGQMLWLGSDNLLDDCIIDKIKTDRQRWLPIEILQNGQYSQEGDIYMVAMAIYEFLMALNIHEDNPMAGYLDCAPFSKLDKSELLKTLYSGEVPLQPDYCPDWLYNILKQCWDRDRTKRPTAEWLVDKIKSSIETAHQPGHYNTVDEEDEDHYEQENYEHLLNCPSNDTGINLSGNIQINDAENYEALNSQSTKTDNYDNLGDISDDDIEQTAVKSVYSDNKTGERFCVKTRSLSCLEDFPGANSESLSCSNYSNKGCQSESDLTSLSSAYFHSEFPDSYDALSDNVYTNDGPYVDAKSVGHTYQNYQHGKKIQSMISDSGIVLASVEDMSSDSTHSSDSSTYFNVENVTNSKSTSECTESQQEPKTAIHKKVLESRLNKDKTTVSKTQARMKPKGKKKRERSRDKLKLSVCNIDMDEPPHEYAPPLVCGLSNIAIGSSSGQSVSDRDSCKSRSSSYTSFCNHEEKCSSSGTSLCPIKLLPRNSRDLSDELSASPTQISSSLPENRTYLDFDTPLSLRVHYRPVADETNVNYTDFDQSQDKKLFIDPSVEQSPNDQYLTVYHV